MSAMSAAVFATGETGHFKRLRPVIAGLVARGLRTHVFTAKLFRDEVARLGGRFEDLFAGRPIEAADATSVPVPARGVAFAGRFGDEIVRAVAPLRPDIVVHDAFAVVGKVVAHHLCVPRVYVCAGHNLAPEPTLAALACDPRVRISPQCWRAVDVLRERHGMPEASPFSYITEVSRDLNLYCEPPEFLLPAERHAFEPIEFFGSLLPDPPAAHGAPAMFPGGDAASRRIYASFGTVIWRYYEAAAVAALQAISTAVETLDDAVALVSLGGRDLPGLAAHLARRNVRVATYVDQWQVLHAASVMITHQGLNSTHEAIWCGVPMISYPFFSDQPGLARRCRELGLAQTLGAELRGPVGPADVRAALARVETTRAGWQARLEQARAWELATMAARPEVIERIVGLIR
jgi:MGT family glycosyltransferase